MIRLEFIIQTNSTLNSQIQYGPENKTMTTSEDLKVHPRMKELYKYFKYNGKLIDIKNYDPEIRS